MSHLWFRVALVLAASSFTTVLAAQPPKKADKTDPPPAPPSILGRGEAPIDLATALRLAGAENPELLLARQRVSEVVAARQFTAAQLLPNLNLGTNLDLHRGPVQQSNGNILKVNRDSLYYGLGANAIGSGPVNIPGLNYNLNVGDAWYGWLAARQRVRVASAAADATRNDVLLRVYIGYLELLRGEGRVAIAKKNREESATVAQMTAAFAQAGQGRKADADRAAVELKRRDMDLVQAEAAVITASARLCQLLNLDPATRLKPIDGWVVPTSIVPDPIPVGELIAIALLQRPELAARRAEVQAMLYELSLAKVLPFSPNVILGFSAGGFGGGSNLVSSPQGFIGGEGQRITGPRFGNFDGRTDFDVAVFWSFRNLGVGNVALVRAADSRMKQSRLREIETLNLVRSQIAEAHALVAANYQQIELAEKAVKSGHSAFTQDLDRIKGGQGLPLEVIDSFRLLARSRYEYLDSIIDYNRAQVQLWVWLGRPPADVLARPVPAELVPPPVIEVQPGPRQFPMPLPVKP